MEIKTIKSLAYDDQYDKFIISFDESGGGANDAYIMDLLSVKSLCKNTVFFCKRHFNDVGQEFPENKIIDSKTLFFETHYKTEKFSGIALSFDIIHRKCFWTIYNGKHKPVEQYIAYTDSSQYPNPASTITLHIPNE